MADIYLPLDTTGKAIGNRVVDESHTLVNRAVRMAVTEYGAFYAESLAVKDRATGKFLTKKQFRASEMLVEETAQYGRRICTVVLVTDPTVSNDILVTYQALGDWNNYSKSQLNIELMKLGTGSEGIDWNDLVDKPSSFPPAAHLHHASEVYGAEYLDDALMRVRNAATMGDTLTRERLVEYIRTKVMEAVDKVDSTTTALLAEHKEHADPHTQYAKLSDFVYALPAVRKPQAITPANNAKKVLLETVLKGSTYYSLYGIAQKAAQFHVSTKADFTNITLLETVLGETQQYQQEGLLPGSKTLYWRVRYQDMDDVWSEWSDTSQFETVPDYPAKGTILSKYCVGVEQWGKIADGRNGSTDQLLDPKSLDCGYIPPKPPGTVLAEFCKGVDKWRTYADGNYGSYDALYQKNSLDCGYVPPPPEGTVLKEYCKGFDLMRDIANGTGGYSTVVYKANSTTCGYVPPPAEGTELRRYCDSFTLHVVLADGKGGERDTIKEYNSKECGYVPPPAAGTILATYCKGFDKYQRIANGDGTDREQLVEQNSSFCGYIPPPPPAAGTILGYQCIGFDKYNKVADGKGSYTLELAQRNAQVCGYSPPPAGTVLAEFCVGVDLWRKYADGNDGSYDRLYQAKSGTCGYIAPTLGKTTWEAAQDFVVTHKADGSIGPHLNEMVVNNNDGSVAWASTEWNVYNSSGQLIQSGFNNDSSFSKKNIAWINFNDFPNKQSYTVYARHGSNILGWAPWSDAWRFSLNWEEFTPEGTVVGQRCIGYDKYDVVADGRGGTFDRLVERNAAYCGYVNPFDPGIDQIPRHLGAAANGTPAYWTLTLGADGNWAFTASRFGTAPGSGRYLTGNTAGWEIYYEAYSEDGEGSPILNIGGYSTWQSLSRGAVISIEDSDSSNDGVGHYGSFLIALRHQGYGAYVEMWFTYNVDGGCFVVGTPILTPEGDVNVEDFEINDIATSFNDPTMIDSSINGWIDWKVDDTSRITVDELSRVVNNRQFKANESIKINGLHSTLTHIHFVYIAATQQYGWKRADEIVVGDAFVTRDRTLIPITVIERIDVPHTFVALNVEDIDTLQVKLGDTYILTHNRS